MAFGYYGGWPAFVPVAERRSKALLEIARMKKAGQPAAPVVVEGRRIAASFWGKAWCDNLESYQDYANRLPRGRSYVRNGSVIDLRIGPREVRAKVIGSQIDSILIAIKPLAAAAWTSIWSTAPAASTSWSSCCRGACPNRSIEQRGAFRPQALSRLGGPPTMRNPFQALLKAARIARKQSLSAARVLQQIALSPKPTRKRAKTGAKAAKRPPRASRRGAPGTFVDGRFSSPHGGLAYKLYTPHGWTRRRLPLVVMLHGCTQSAADFALGTGMNELADELGFLALYPQQAVWANLGRCWNWHRPGDQKRGSGEPAAIAALTRHIIATCKANSARVYIAGISAGGAAAAIIASAYPEIYVAVGVHSGLVHGNVSTLRGALSAMRTGADAGGKTTRPPPTIIFHGNQDRVVHPSNANGFLNQLQRSSPHPIISRTETGRSAGGRDFTRTVYRRRLGEPLLEVWTVHGGGHAWSGGSAAGSHTDPAGPDASREMMRFFFACKRSVVGGARARAGVSA